MHTFFDVLMVLGLLFETFLLGHVLHQQKPPPEQPQHLPAAVPEPAPQSLTLNLHDRLGKLRHEVSCHLPSAPETWSYGGRTYERVGEKDGIVKYQELGA